LGPVFTNAFSASVKFILASNPGVVDWACAVEPRAKVLTGPGMHAGVTNTSVRRRLALLPIRSRRTDAKVILEEVDAFGTILTRCGVTESNVRFARLAGPAREAATVEPVHAIHAAPTIETFHALAFVDVHVAGKAGVAGTTLTFKFIVQIQTGFRSF